MNRKLTLIAIILSALLGAVVLIARDFFINRNDYFSIEDKALRAITEDNSELLYDDKPVIEVTSVSSFNNGWNIATIKSLRSTEKFVPVKVILLDTDDILRVVAGPDTHFSEPELLRLNVPDSVILELQKL